MRRFNARYVTENVPPPQAGSVAAACINPAWRVLTKSSRIPEECKSLKRGGLLFRYLANLIAAVAHLERLSVPRAPRAQGR